MFAALDLLREQPMLGVGRRDIATDARSHRMQKHVIYYRILSDSIMILRILHERQSTLGQFEATNDE
jgi:plasmid stabilization system protein ParE